MSSRSWQSAAELDWDNHPDDEGNQRRVVCKVCGADIPADGQCWYCENNPDDEGNWTQETQMKPELRDKLESNTNALLVELKREERTGSPVDFQAMRILVLRLYELAFMPEYLHSDPEFFETVFVEELEDDAE